MQFGFMGGGGPGASNPVPFAATDFGGTGALTWTVAAGDVSYYRSALNGKFLSIWINLQTTTVGGVVVGNNLTMKLPGGALALGTAAYAALAAPGGLPLEGVAVATTPGSNLLTILRYAANWVVGADNTAFAFNGTVEIQ